MSIITKFFSPKTTVTSAAMRAETDRAENEITTLRAQLEAATAEIGGMTDAQHSAFEADTAAQRRALARLESRVAHLTSELPAMLEAELAAEKVAADATLRARAEASRKANSVEAKKLLADYDAHAAAIGDILNRLDEIAAETNSCNTALHRTPGAESITGYETLYRKSPGRGLYELSLFALVLPPGFAGGRSAWPHA